MPLVCFCHPLIKITVSILVSLNLSKYVVKIHEDFNYRKNFTMDKSNFVRYILNDKLWTYGKLQNDGMCLLSAQEIWEMQ